MVPFVSFGQTTYYGYVPRNSQTQTYKVKETTSRLKQSINSSSSNIFPVERTFEIENTSRNNQGAYRNPQYIAPPVNNTAKNIQDAAQSISNSIIQAAANREAQLRSMGYSSYGDYASERRRIRKENRKRRKNPNWLDKEIDLNKDGKVDFQDYLLMRKNKEPKAISSSIKERVNKVKVKKQENKLDLRSKKELAKLELGSKKEEVELRKNLILKEFEFNKSDLTDYLWTCEMGDYLYSYPEIDSKYRLLEIKEGELVRIAKGSIDFKFWVKVYFKNKVGYINKAFFNTNAIEKPL
tara:strand:- start:82 stop:969 length:888 start_codon:yes stop_codon:yes gene_type:complete